MFNVGDVVEVRFVATVMKVENDNTIDNPRIQYVVRRDVAGGGSEMAFVRESSVSKAVTPEEVK